LFFIARLIEQWNMVRLPIIKHLGLADYVTTYDAMRAHNRAMTEATADEIWLLEHPPTFTLGLAGKPEHILNAGDIPVIKIDRGGQVTYHGPGQLVVYLLLNMQHHKFGVKSLVNRIEQSVIDLLAEFNINALRREAMPGVYVNTAKIAAIGLRVANHATYHGLALNIDMNLEPFSRINPCGYEGLAVTQMRDCGVTAKMDVIAEKLLVHLQRNCYD
jgi:lipoyl(octanoyl) transferase